METFERSLLLHLLELYDAHLSSGYEPPKKKYKMVQELRKALFKPHKVTCFRSHGICYYSLSTHHMKECVGYNKCGFALGKKRDERSIVFK